jgi:hypothetical protein
VRRAGRISDLKRESSIGRGTAASPASIDLNLEGTHRWARCLSRLRVLRLSLRLTPPPSAPLSGSSPSSSSSSSSETFARFEPPFAPRVPVALDDEDEAPLGL